MHQSKFKQEDLFNHNSRKFPRIKFEDCDSKLINKLKDDLLEVQKSILSYSPSDFNKGKLDRIRIRVLKFSKKETCNEFFVILGNKKYVCLNSSLLKKRYYAGLQHVLHGIAHHFCNFTNEISSEVFCEFVSYSIVEELIKDYNKYSQKKIIGSIMKVSSKDYNSYYKIGKKLNKKDKGLLIKLNKKVKDNKIRKKKEKKLFSKLLKSKIKKYDYVVKKLPELEDGFKIVS